MDGAGQAVQSAFDLAGLVDYAQVLGQRRLQFYELSFAPSDLMDGGHHAGEVVAQRDDAFQRSLDVFHELFLPVVNDVKHLAQPLLAHRVERLMSRVEDVQRFGPSAGLGALSLVESVQDRFDRQGPGRGLPIDVAGDQLQRLLIGFLHDA